MIHVAAVPYLNSKVLVWGLEKPAPGDEPYTLEFQVPSTLAQSLACGQVDVGLLSSIEYFTQPNYKIVRGPCVSGRGVMWSIRLFYRGALKKLKRVALDPASVTTNALLRIVLEQRLGLRPEYVNLAPGQDAAQRKDLDGMLKIGDPCLAFHAPGCEALDLLGEWDALTGLPFVFAAWLVREKTPIGRLGARLRAARDAGLQNVGAIAQAHHAEVGLSVERAREYVEKIVRYDLGPQELNGLAEFQRRLVQLGILSREKPIELVD